MEEIYRLWLQTVILVEAFHFLIYAIKMNSIWNGGWAALNVGRFNVANSAAVVCALPLGGDREILNIAFLARRLFSRH